MGLLEKIFGDLNAQEVKKIVDVHKDRVIFIRLAFFCDPVVIFVGLHIIIGDFIRRGVGEREEVDRYREFESKYRPLSQVKYVTTPPPGYSFG